MGVGDQLDHVAEDEAGQQVGTGLSLPGRPGISRSGERKLVNLASRVTSSAAVSVYWSCSSALVLSPSRYKDGSDSQI